MTTKIKLIVVVDVGEDYSGPVNVQSVVIDGVTYAADSLEVTLEGVQD